MDVVVVVVVVVVVGTAMVVVTKATVVVGSVGGVVLLAVVGGVANSATGAAVVGICTAGEIVVAGELANGADPSWGGSSDESLDPPPPQLAATRTTAMATAKNDQILQRPRGCLAGRRVSSERLPPPPRDVVSGLRIWS